MNVTGPAPVAIVQRLDDTDLVLRLNQRFNAEVMQVSGDRVVLSINGVQLVARMASFDQAAQLTDRRQAQFIVKEVSPSLITLQLAARNEVEGQDAQAQLASILPQLLQNAQIPVSAETLVIAKALVLNGLPVSLETISELEKFLAHIPGWNEEDAHNAAFLKTQGLPVSSESVQLFKLELPPLAEMIQQLQAQLGKYLTENPNSGANVLGAATLEILQNLMVKTGVNESGIEQQLQAAIKILGESIEYDLAGLATSTSLNLKPELLKSLLVIGLARRQLERSDAPRTLLQSVDRLLDGLRLMQLFNSNSERVSSQDQWLQLNLPLLMVGFNYPERSLSQENTHTAELRIAYLPDEIPPKIDPQHTRLLLRVDLGRDQSIEVDLSLADRRLGVQVTTSSERLLEYAERELPGFKDSMEALGYSVQNLRCAQGDLAAGREAGSARGWGVFHDIYVGV